MAKVRVINNNLDGNLVGERFVSDISKTIFSLGSFVVTSNFKGADSGVSYGGELTGFVKPITLNTLKLAEDVSRLVEEKNRNIQLNLDNSDLASFVRFGSTREYLRMCIEGIISKFPGGIFMNPMKQRGSNITYYDYTYNAPTNESTFKIPINSIDNPFDLIIETGVLGLKNGNPLSNIEKSYSNFSVSLNSDIKKEYKILEFIGKKENKPYLELRVEGDLFLGVGLDRTSFHIKPNNEYYETFKLSLVDFEKYILSKKSGLDGYIFTLKIPKDLESGNIVYSQSILNWKTTDGYNLDIQGPSYRSFLTAILNAGEAYDSIKTDIIYNMLVPKSLLMYDLTDEQKISKLLRIYGKQIDKIRIFIDSLLYIHNLSYNKINNTPDKLLNNLARSFGWKDLFIRGENDIVKQIFNAGEVEGEEVNFEEINIELWRRILLNTNYFWKSKGTRHSIIAILRLLGLPEEFINFNEFVYTADGIINPNSVQLTLDDFPTQTVSYYENGFPKAPLEGSNFYFQISGATDNGQTYMDIFRKVGFDIYPEIDNVKIVVPEDNYVEERGIDNRLIINTKIVDINLDASRAIEYDFYKYITEIDYPANKEGYTLPAAYINVALEMGDPLIFELPPSPLYNFEISDLEVRYNGILKTLDEDYVFIYSGLTPTHLQLINITEQDFYNTIPNVIQITYLRATEDVEEFISEFDVKYVVQRIIPDITGTVILLPETPKGQIQLTINGIALTEGSNQYNGDYIFVGENRIHIYNADLINYFQSTPNPYILLSYLTYTPNEELDVEGFELRSESLRYFGTNTSKFYTIIYGGEQRYVYKLNYRVANEENVKILVDGISIKPYDSLNPDEPWDYKINRVGGTLTENYEIILNVNNITLGSIITAYYLVGENVLPLIIPGIDPTLSFFDFIGALETQLIDVRTRKVITDYSTGWYPVLFKIYVDYLRRSQLDSNNPLLSNAYVFRDTINFLKKHGLTVSTFMGFINQLLPATAILRKEGVLIRNTIFTKQKHKYKRGVYFNINEDWKSHFDDYYLGDDGSYFKKEYAYEESEWMERFIVEKFDLEINSGYFGVVDAMDFVDGNTIIEEVFGVENVPGTDLGNSNSGWVGFYHNENYLFVSKKPLLHNISWNDIYNAGVVFGVDGFGPYNSGVGVLQNKRITIGGFEYKIRLLTGGNGNPATSSGGEWNGLMYRIHTSDPLNLDNNLWDNFVNNDLGIGLSNSGSGSWCQETYYYQPLYPNLSVLRGITGISSYTNQLKSEPSLFSSWRPVLELIKPWK